MQKKELNRIIEQIAKMHGTSAKEVRKEMEFAMEAAQKSTDPIVQAQWASIPCKGDRPTLEEFITFLVAHTAN